MATDRIAWELTADPVPIERAFERAGLAADRASGKVKDAMQKNQESINNLSNRLSSLSQAYQKTNDPKSQQRLTIAIQSTQKALDAAKQSAVQLDQAAKKAAQSSQQAFAEVNKGTNGLVSQLKSLPGLMLAGFSIGAVIAFTKEVITATGELQSFQARMEGLMGSSELGNQKLDELRQTSQELGLNFSDMTSNYIQFVSAAKSQGRSIEEADLIFKNMSVAIAGAGVSSEAANRAMTALQQMMGKGTIAAEELKGQLGEALPQAIGWMQEATGKSTKELMKMMEQGQLTADVLLNFSRVAADAMGDNVQNMAEQLNAKTNRLANSWQKFLTQVGSSGIAEGAIDGLTMAVDALSFAWAAATLNLGDYIHEQEKAERLANMSEAEKIITKQVQAQIKSYGDEEVAIEQLNAQLETQRDKLHDINRAIESNKKSAIRGGFIPVPNQEELDRMAVVEKVLEQELMYLRKGSLENATITGESEKQRKEREAIVKAQERFNQLLREWMLDSKRIKELDTTPKIPDYAKDMGKTREQLAEEQARLGNEQIETQRLIDAEFERLDKDKTEKEKKEAEKRKEIAEKEREIKLQQAQLIGESAIELTGLLSNAYQAQTIDLQRQLDQGLITQENYEARLRQIKRKEFEVDRLASLAKIAINTAVQASAATPLLAPFVIAAGAAQAIVVATRPNPYAKGTKRVTGGEKGKDSVLYDSPTGLSALMPDEMIMPAKKTIAHAPYLDNVFDGRISPTQSRWAAGLFVNQTIEPGLLKYMASISGGGGYSDSRQIGQLVRAITKKKSPDFNKPADRIVRAIYNTSNSNSFSSWRKYKK